MNHSMFKTFNLGKTLNDRYGYDYEVNGVTFSGDVKVTSLGLRFITTCALNQDDFLYLGASCLNPKDRIDVEKGCKLAFQQALDAFLDESYNNEIFDKEAINEIKAEFWQSLLANLATERNNA